MTLNELAATLDICEEIPEYLYKAYEESQNDSFPMTRPDLIRLQAEYSLFDEDVFSAVLDSFDSVVQNGSLLKWAVVLRRVLINFVDTETLYSIPYPKMNGEKGRDMLTLFPLLSLFEDALPRYERFGFSLEETLREFAVFNSSVKRSETGRFAFDRRFFAWSSAYIYGNVFRCGALNFEITEFPDPVAVIENVKSGERVILITEGSFHRSGNALLSVGFSEDTAGSFNADFFETDTEFFGRVAKEGVVSSETRSFPKSEWDMVFGKGDKGVSLHIPGGVDVSRESVKATVREGMARVKRSFGEKIKFAFCRSWLLSPNISECLSQTSKIIEFENCFERYPIRSSGNELMFFLFGGAYENYEDLPERTSLQRNIKRKYLDGGYIHAGAGIITDKDFYQKSLT